MVKRKVEKNRKMTRVSRISGISFCLILSVIGNAISSDKADKEINVKDVAEEWFTKQATGSLGKRFLEKVKCKKFISFFKENYANIYGTSQKYSEKEVTVVVG